MVIILVVRVFIFYSLNQTNEIPKYTFIKNIFVFVLIL